jgi:hypothetical protein
MPRFAANTALIAQGLQNRESDEARALGYLQRLNLAGLDIKGQLSSAYGQSGVGLTLAAQVDFGALLVPFVHLDLGLSLEGAVTAHSLLVLQRLPKTAWDQDIPQPPQPPKDDPSASAPPFALPLWQTQRPLALAFLTGWTRRIKVTALADAWAGFGSFDDFDETGLTVGVKTSATVGGTLTRLADAQPRHYPPTPSDSRLANDVDDLFEARLKAKVAAWLLECGGDIQGLDALGVPRVSLRQRALDAGLDEKAQAALLQTLDAYDKLTINDIDSVAMVGLAIDVIRAMVAAAKKVKAMVSSKSLKTDDLLAQLNAVKTALEIWIATLKSPRGNEFLSGDVRRQLWETMVLRHKEARDLIGALERRQARKVRPTPVAPVPAATPVSPPVLLDLVMLEGGVQFGAGAKLVLPKELEKAKLTLEAECQTRRIAYRYQAPVPGSGNRTLLSSQETVVSYVSRKVTGQGSSRGERGFFKERSNLVTMSYRSVHVQWFDDLRQHNSEALPNGSGVSFGMSVLATSFSAYASACKKLGQPKPGSPLVPMDAGLADLEAALTKQLRVAPEELRSFMRQAPSWTGQVTLDLDSKTAVESYMVESSFAFKAPQKLLIESRRPKALFDLGPVKKILAPGSKNTPAPRPDELRLQVLRLRFRVRSDDDKSRSLIQLGWNPNPWSEDEITPWGIGSNSASDPWYVRLTGIDPSLPNWMKLPSLAVQLGIGVEWVRRVGSEGIVELHQYFFPHPYSHKDPPAGYGLARAKELENANWYAISALLVPPVALFSQ